MTRTIQCVKLGREAEGLEHVPMKGELGLRIYENVSKEAWGMWVKHSTMVINEYRLNPSEPKAQEVLAKQLEDFFFGEGVEAPPDYVDPNASAEASGESKPE